MSCFSYKLPIKNDWIINEKTVIDVSYGLTLRFEGIFTSGKQALDSSVMLEPSNFPALKATLVLQKWLGVMVATMASYASLEELGLI